MEPIARSGRIGGACQLFVAFERRITITRLANGQVRGLASSRTVVEPSRKRAVIS